VGSRVSVVTGVSVSIGSELSTIWRNNLPSVVGRRRLEVERIDEVEEAIGLCACW